MASHTNKTETITDLFSAPIIVIATFVNSTITFINALLLVVLWRASHLRRNQPNIVFLITLITTHCAVGLGCFAVFPGAVIANVSAEFALEMLYWLEHYLRIVFSNTYSLLVAMLVDRVVAVKKPFIYQRFTHKHAGMVILLTLILPTTYTICLLWSFEDVSMSCSFLYLFTGGFLVFGNLAIFLDVKKQLIQIRGITTVSGDDSGHKLFKRKLLKSTLVSLSFAFTFILLLFPFMLNMVVNVFKGAYHSKDYIKFAYIYILWHLGMSNSIIDPVIYVMLNKPVRKAIMKALRCHRSAIEPTTSTSRTSES